MNEMRHLHTREIQMYVEEMMKIMKEVGMVKTATRCGRIYLEGVSGANSLF